MKTVYEYSYMWKTYENCIRIYVYMSHRGGVSYMRVLFDKNQETT